MSSDALTLTTASDPDGAASNGETSTLENTPDDANNGDAEIITEAYVKLSTVQWEWGRRLPKWQRNAVHSIVMPEPLVDPSHPLREPGSSGIRLYDVTDSTGCTKVSMSLRQLEYVQYYIHEMRLADPVWTKHLTSAPLEQADEADNSVGPPEYPPGEEWVPLPDEFVYGDTLAKVPIYFDDAKEMKRYQNKQRSANKKILTRKMIADDREFDAAKAKMVGAKAKATEIYEKERREAQEDNETEGPGFRRGPEKRHHPRSVHPVADGGENDDESEFEKVNPKAGWGGFPLATKEQSLADVKTIADPEGLPFSTDTTSLPGTEFSSASAPPSPPSQTLSNFSTAYYDHAQQALLIATLGGMFEAQKGQPQYLREMVNLTETAPIGRSLFVSLRVVTWEVDDATVLEIGWSALWWQEKTDAAGERMCGEDGFDELRDAGHIKIADHLRDKANGTWKPNNRNDYQFGDSLPIASKDASRAMQDKIKDLSARAGGGPTYIVLHSTDGTHADPSKIGLATKEWYGQFKPPHWDYPCYACVDGIGKTFIIESEHWHDTAILMAAAEHDPSSGPAPIKTRLSMEEAAWLVFHKDDMRQPHFCGNAGNDAFYNLELFIALVTAPSLHSLRKDVEKAKAAPKPALPDPADVLSDETIVADDNGHATTRTGGDVKSSAVHDGGDERFYEDVDDDDDDSEDGRIIGVYGLGPDGELVQLD